MIKSRIDANPDIFSSPLSKEISWLINGVTTRNFNKNLKDIETSKDKFVEQLKSDFPEITGIVWAEQIHGTHIEVIDTFDTDMHPSRIFQVKQCDGLLTSLHKLMLCIFTADCVPLSFVDVRSGLIGAVHSGWKGTYENITAKMIDLMKKQGSDPEYIKVWIGPSIGLCCYEVSEDLITKFQERFNNYTNIIDNKKLNLQEINKQHLINEGIPSENIYVSNTCTKCNSHTFYSYRKQPESEGRMATLIMWY